MIWAVLMLLSGLLTMFVWRKSDKWREAAEARDGGHHASASNLNSSSNTV